ncbi:hypothetical protein ARMSODRAFT_1010085, partial [Armillaria solidipes]
MADGRSEGVLDYRSTETLRLLVAKQTREEGSDAILMRNVKFTGRSRLAPPPPYSEDIERGVNETSPLYHANPVRYTVPREITDAYQSTSTSSSCKTLQTILLFSIFAIVFTLYLHERTKSIHPGQENFAFATCVLAFTCVHLRFIG